MDDYSLDLNAAPVFCTAPQHTMTAIHIQRAHSMELSAARQVAHAWAEQAISDFGMECRYETGVDEDTLYFSRPGVTGTLRIDTLCFDMTAQLGFLFSAFKDRIEAKIHQQMDALLGNDDVLMAQKESSSSTT